jgi:hypothetical protein
LRVTIENNEENVTKNCRLPKFPPQAHITSG